MGGIARCSGVGGLQYAAAHACARPDAGARTCPAPAPAPPAVPSPPVALPSPPVVDAVAARFPEPAVNYRLPALQDGRSGFTTQAELQTLVRGLALNAAPGVQLLSLGSSQVGVPIEALLFTQSTDPSGAALRSSGRPTVLLVGQQHGDEPAGSEALLVVAQELARGSLRGLLDRINVLLLPRANPDGAQAAAAPRPTASTSTETNCCSAAPKRRRWRS